MYNVLIDCQAFSSKKAVNDSYNNKIIVVVLNY